MGKTKVNSIIEFENNLNLAEEAKLYKTKLTNDGFIENYKNTISKRKEDYQKCRWMSDSQMNLRFEMAKKVINFNKIKTWLDVGCGTGNFFESVLNDNNSIQSITGTDAVNTFINISKEKNKKFNNVQQKFYVKNLYDLDPPTDGTFDMVSMSGLLQLLDLDKIELTILKLASLVKHSGIIFIDTLNYNYYTINTRRKHGLWYFRKEELIKLFELNGFSNIDCNTFNSKLQIKNNDGMYVYCLGRKD
jgi:2-polyprenyl-3-methyl-5-hydroxy-6-metoxy-1,4-benzoquinol methylase